MMKVRELRRILEGFDNEAEIKVVNVIVEHEPILSDVMNITYNVENKTVCLVGEGVIIDGVDDEENIPTDNEENAPADEENASEGE